MNRHVRRIGRIILRAAAALVLLAAVLALSAVLIFRSGWFRELVHRRIIAEMENATGAKVEIGSFRFDWKQLEAEVSPVVLHGKESAKDAPFVRIASAKIGLKIISMLERKVDLSYLRVDQPRVHIVFYPDGSTNIPEPRVRRPESNWAEDLIQLAVRNYEVTNGMFDYDDRQIPLDFRGENLNVIMSYDVIGRYRGDIASRPVRIVLPEGPIEADASASFVLDKSKIEFSKLIVATKESRAELAGDLTDWRTPKGAFTVKATIAAREAVALLHVPIERTGSVAFDGKTAFALITPFEYRLDGRVNGRGLGFHQDRIRFDNTSIQADIAISPDKITLRNASATALGSKIVGEATLTKWRDFHAEGNIHGLSLQKAAAIAYDHALPWSGSVAGGFTLDGTIGKKTIKAQADLGIYPGTEGQQVEGHLGVVYDQAAETLALLDSYLTTTSTRAEFSGTLGEAMTVSITSTNLNDLLPALALAGENAPKELPLKLNAGGMASINGSFRGDFDSPHFVGQASVTHGIVEGHAFDSFHAHIDADRSTLNLTQAVLTRGETSVEGQAKLVAQNGSFNDANIDAQINLRNAQIAELSKEAGATVEISGTGSATAHIIGTITKPQAQGTVQVENLAAYGERFDRLQATLHYTGEQLEISGGDAAMMQSQSRPGRLRFQGSYKPKTNEDWKNGDARFDITATNLSATRIRSFEKLSFKTEAVITAKLNGAAHLVNGDPVLESLTGDFSARNVIVDGNAIGDLSATIETHGSDMNVRASAKVRGMTLVGEGSWKLQGDQPGTASIKIPRVDLATLHTILKIGTKEEEEQLPFEGFVEGTANITVALAKPENFKADVTINSLQVNPRSTQTLKLGVQAQDVVLKNTQPVEVTITTKEARIKSAKFEARDTSLEASGGIPFDPKGSADLVVRGAVNLTILQLLNPDLLARGNATVQLVLRGSVRDPQIIGRMELKNASLYLTDLPNGVDSANGVVLFDRSRATIEKLTADTGGGTVSFTGFVEFHDVLTYRLQADVRQVRVRYPEDVSTTFNAKLALNGTSDASTLSGSIALSRATFNPRSDLGSMLAQAAKPVPAAAPNEYLRGLQFDVRIESGPSFEFQTSLTRDVEAEVDLRLRGSVIRPVLLGTISVNQGEIEVFGNRYTVNRGDIRFLNPVKIEPSFDMNLETKARGITVEISFSGTLQRLNVNYSSDPPLQSSQIIQLLAVGRDPNTSSTTATQASTSSTTGLEAGGGLLGQAISAQLSSRLQRFFGASRVKIDPTVTGVDNLPQARLTIEQQISKEVTMTYITNLNRTQEQVVQVVWDFNQRWSAIAVRQDNGIFAIDFTYKKRFK